MLLEQDVFCHFSPTELSAVVPVIKFWVCLSLYIDMDLF